MSYALHVVDSPLQVRPLRRIEYDRLVAAGMFEGERIELLRGALVVMSPQSLEHIVAIRRLTMILAPALVGRAVVQVQGPLAVSDDSEPEPDVSIVTGDEDALPSTAFLVIEVAVSSVRTDMEVKARIYGEAGVPEYWVVDVPRRVVVRHLSPEGDAYRAVTEHGAEERLGLQSFPDVAIHVGEILPQR